MAEQSFARYVSFGSQAVEGLKRTLLTQFLEQAVEIVRAEIVAVMEEGNPSGRVYPLPGGGTYTASAPGEPPAIRTGEYLRAWDTTDVVDQGTRLVAWALNTIRVGNNIPLWKILEFGSVRMAPRGHVITGVERARPKIEALAKEFSSLTLRAA